MITPHVLARCRALLDTSPLPASDRVRLELDAELTALVVATVRARIDDDATITQSRVRRRRGLPPAPSRDI